MNQFTTLFDVIIDQDQCSPNDADHFKAYNHRTQQDTFFALLPDDHQNTAFAYQVRVNEDQVICSNTPLAYLEAIVMFEAAMRLFDSAFSDINFLSEDSTIKELHEVVIAMDSNSGSIVLTDAYRYPLIGYTR